MIFPSPESPIPSPRISGKLRGMNTPTALHIVPVTDRRGLDDFIEVPFSIYRNDPNWVPPLRFERREELARTKHLSEHAQWQQNGRASCRERVCQYGWNPVVAGRLKQ